MGKFSHSRSMLRIASALVVTVSFGCSSVSNGQKDNIFSINTISDGWRAQVLHTKNFDLQSVSNQQKNVDGVLTIYIEGDGHAWLPAGTPSQDPTPLRPLAFELAKVQKSGAIAYLGRPCQFIGVGMNPLCNQSAWTNARYSEAVVDSTNQAIDQLKNHALAHTINLVGFSGGATVALLVAARRIDVKQIISVAGNLDPQAWVTEFGLMPLEGSLNPTTIIPAIATVPQLYFVGGKDKIIPLFLTKDFVQKFPPHQRPKVVVFAEYGHICCWVEQWPVLWSKAFQD